MAALMGRTIAPLTFAALYTCLANSWRLAQLLGLPLVVCVFASCDRHSTTGAPVFLSLPRSTVNAGDELTVQLHIDQFVFPRPPTAISSAALVAGEIDERSGKVVRSKEPWFDGDGRATDWQFHISID